jgi:hypothetical protein
MSATIIGETPPSNKRLLVHRAFTSEIHGLCKFQIRMFSRIASSGMLRRVALVRTEVSEELSAFIIRMTKMG